MATITGVLKEARKRPNGICSIFVDGVWYGTYKTDYSELEGKAVKFDYSERQVGTNVYKNAENVEALPEAEQKAVQQASKSADDDRQRSIVLQSSFKVAAEVVSSLVQSDKLPAVAKKDVLDTTAGYVEELASRFFFDCIDPAGFLESRGFVDAEEAEASSDGYDPMEA